MITVFCLVQLIILPIFLFLRFVLLFYTSHVLLIILLWILLLLTAHLCTYLFQKSQFDAYIELGDTCGQNGTNNSFAYIIINAKFSFIVPTPSRSSEDLQEVSLSHS